MPAGADCRQTTCGVARGVSSRAQHEYKLMLSHATQEGEAVVTIFTKDLTVSDVVGGSHVSAWPDVIAPLQVATSTSSTYTEWFAAPFGTMLTTARTPASTIGDCTESIIHCGGPALAVHLPVSVGGC